MLRWQKIMAKKILAKKKIRKRKVHANPNLTKGEKIAAVVTGVAGAAAITTAVMMAPHSVTIVLRSDSSEFERRVMTMDTTLYKSATTPLADQMQAPLSINPEKFDGFEYTGCTDEDGKPFDINKRNPIATDVTLYYNYKEALSPVAFIEDGKVSLMVNESLSQTVDASKVLPAFTEDHQYDDFTGWTETTPDAVQGVISTADEAVKIYEAQWTPKTFKITYDYDGGSAEGNPETYQYGVGVDAFQDAVKSGYSFDGWYDDSGNKITSIAKDAHDDINLTARYTAIPVAQSYAPSASASNGWSYHAPYTAPASSSDQSNGGSAGGSYQPSGTAGSVAFDTGYNVGLNWGMTQFNIDLWDMAAVDSYWYNEGSGDYAWYDNGDGTRTWRQADSRRHDYYGIADHDNQGGAEVEWASVMYLNINGQSYTLRKLDTIYDDEDGHYGDPSKYGDRAAAEGAVVVFQTCTSTGVEYVLWG